MIDWSINQSIVPDQVPSLLCIRVVLGISPGHILDLILKYQSINQSSDVDPDPQSLFNPDPDPDPGRIQVHKISKFSKHLLIFKSQKKLLIVKSLCTYFFKGLELIHIISCEKKRFLLVKLCFSLYFISDFIPLDPDPHHWINQSINHTIDKSIKKQIINQSTNQSINK